MAAPPAAAADPRDNPAWHALRGPLARFVDPTTKPTTPPVLRFDPEVAIFTAMERLDEASWAAHAEMAGVGGFAVLFRDRVPEPPAGWHEQYRGPCVQMVAGDVPEPPAFDFVELGPDDGPEMLALAQRTEPGPFFARTHELGRYVGVRRGGRLLAMAGERFRVPGHVEVSAVCTHPDVRGEGLGGALTLEVVRAIRARGDEAFLHALTTNENAIRLYRKLGFELRREVDVVAAQWRDDGLQALAPREPLEGDTASHLPDPHRAAPGGDDG